MGKLAILIFSTPYTFQNTHTAIKLIQAVLKKGHEVLGVYFYMDGVINTLKTPNISAEGGKTIEELLKELAAKGCKIKICPVCASYRGVDNEELHIEEAEFDGLGALEEFVAECDKFICLGL